MNLACIYRLLCHLWRCKGLITTSNVQFYWCTHAVTSIIPYINRCCSYLQKGLLDNFRLEFKHRLTKEGQVIIPERYTINSGQCLWKALMTCSKLSSDKFLHITLWISTYRPISVSLYCLFFIQINKMLLHSIWHSLATLLGTPVQLIWQILDIAQCIKT